jgi:sugar phosphate isomerase/epimerase
MWDFSWLERRWPGAGYENWDEALDELTERGYNAVRIDAFRTWYPRTPKRNGHYTKFGAFKIGVARI